MRKVRCIVVEDEKPSRDELKFLLGQYECLEIVDEADNGLSALEKIKDKKPDLVFLDINMPGLTGIELVSHFMYLTHKPKVIFTTAHRDYAVSAFELEAIDYILKPYEDRRIQQTIEKIIREFHVATQMSKSPQLSQPIHNTHQRLAVQNGEKTILLSIDQISYVTTDKEKIIVFSQLGCFESNNTLSDLQQKTGFFKIHRSTLVNFSFLHEIYPWFNGTYQVVLNDQDKTVLTVSRSYVKALKESLRL